MADSKEYYKLIFDAIFEKKSLEELVEKLSRAIDANVSIILNSGESVTDIERKASDYLGLNGLPEPDDIKILEQEKILSLDETKECIMEPVLKDGKRIGNIIIEYVKKEKQIDYRGIAVSLAEAVAGTLPKPSSYFYRGWSLSKSVINRLLFDEKLKEYIPTIEKHFAPPYVAMLVESEGKETELKSLLLSLNIPEAERYYMVQEKQTFIVYGGKVTTEQLMDATKNTNIRVIISEQFQKLEELAERQESLRMIREIVFRSSESLQFREREWYVQARVYHVRQFMKDSEIQNIQIQKLLYEDEKKNGELFETLKRYLICANNLAETAKALHIHRNTLVYRLKQIDEILEYNINDVKDSRELLTYMMIAF